VLRSVARRRPVETENPSACATVNWKFCKSAIALYGLWVQPVLTIIESDRKVLINPIIRSRTRYYRHAYPHTRDIIIPFNKLLQAVFLGLNSGLRVRKCMASCSGTVVAPTLWEEEWHTTYTQSAVITYTPNNRGQVSNHGQYLYKFCGLLGCNVVYYCDTDVSDKHGVSGI
jgi:hypothetical protein